MSRFSLAGLVVVVGSACPARGPAETPSMQAEGHYVAGTSAYLKGDFVEAHTHFEQVRALAPRDPRLPFAEGELFMAEHRLDEAIARFEASAALEPKRGTTWSRLGVLYGLKGQHERAKQALDKALALNPKDYNAHEALGDAALEKGELDVAVRRYLLAADVAPVAIGAELTLKAAHELSKAKQASRALTVLEEGRRKGITSAALAQELGDRYVDVSRWDDAIAAYTDAAAKDPSAWELVAELEVRQGRPERAEDAWTKAIAAKDQALYHVGLARLCLAQKNSACAQRELDRALATATGEEVRESMELAQLLTSMGRKGDGLKLLDAVAAEADQRSNEVLQRATAKLAKELADAAVLAKVCARLTPPCP